MGTTTKFKTGYWNISLFIDMSNSSQQKMLLLFSNAKRFVYFSNMIILYVGINWDTLTLMIFYQ